MAMGGMLRNLAAKGAAGLRASAADAHVVDDRQRLAMLDAFEEEEIGWFWATDADNRLIYLSPSAARRLGEGRKAIGEALGKIVEAVSSGTFHSPSISAPDVEMLRKVPL